ncbi:MAG: 8-oxo-dGTP pyrophosphatase MutT (NUDIX family) [Cellvibrionaceae bacterium]|jgi:8-oxo-dGTP pyrophosphatase MutT (NUDIX family)
MADYVKWIRSKVGHDPIFLNVAGAYVTDDEGRILLQKRSATEELWGLPGGAMDLGESAEETAIREMREETGLEIEIDHLVGIYTKYIHSYSNGDVVQPIYHSFKGTIVGGELYIDHKETFDLKFFAPDEMPNLFNQQMKDAMEDILAGKRGVFR